MNMEQGGDCAGAMAKSRDVTVYWRPHHEVYPELPREPDFLAFDEASETSVGWVCLIPAGHDV